jgi:hypothetical protein
MSAIEENVGLKVIKRGDKTKVKQKVMPARQLYRRSTVARMLDCDIQLLRRIEADGRLTPVRLRSMHVFYDAGEVDRLVKGAKRKGARR